MPDEQQPSRLMGVLQGAIRLAAEAHAGQSDKGGAPYIQHPLRVMSRMSTEEERIVAALHDVWEDAGERMGERVAMLIEGLDDEAARRMLAALTLLTRKTDEPYEAFIRRVAEDPLARRVKLADIEDNLDLSRIPEPTPEDLARHRRYEAARTVLLAADSAERD